MAYIKPQVLLHEEFAQSTDAAESVLRAVIVGPNAKLHRYSDSDEKLTIDCGKYTPGTDTSHPYPATQDRVPGSVVDKEYSKLYVDDALFSYYEKLDQSTVSEQSGVIFYNEPGTPNIVRGTGFNFVDNGDSYNRASALGIRDVQVGDYVWLRSYTDNPSDGGCAYKEHISKIVDFAPEPTLATIGAVTDASVEVEAVTYSAAGTYAETTNAPVFSLDASGYNAYVAGNFQPNYVITITRVDQTASCSLAVYANITSAGDFDNRYDVQITEGEDIEIGSFGMSGKFTSNLNKLQVGDKVTITGKSEFTKPTDDQDATVPCLAVSGTYTGLVNDTYIVTVLRGGTPANNDGCPIISFQTSNGNDYCTNIYVKDTNAHAYGGNGLSFQIKCPVYTGQQFTFNVTAADNGAICGLVLQSDLPARLRTTSAANKVPLDIRLLTKKDLVLEAGASGNPNFTQGDSTFTVNGNITLTDPEFLQTNLEPITLKLFDGELFLEYREWVPTTVGELNFCDSLEALDLIPGQLDPDNPLKYGVYKALGSSNGVSVGYVGVKDPTNKDKWQEAFDVLEGAEDVYTIVPLTQDITVINQARTLIELESGAEQCRWKTGLFCVKLETEKMIVGQNLVNNELWETSSDKKITQFEIYADPADQTSFTMVSLTSDNADFEAYGVKAGDELRMVDGTTYVIEEVISNHTFSLVSGPSTASVAPFKAEIWHKMTKLEQAVYYGELAQSLISRRTNVVNPDRVGEGGQVLPGYFVAARIAGEKSGINAYQSLTHTEVTGFDDFSASKPYWTESQLDILAAHGVMIVVEDSNGTPYIRHALNTDMSDAFHREESITRDFDYVCKTLHSVLQNFIGRVTITDETLSTVETAMEATLDSLRGSQHIRDYSNLVVRQHALLADRVEVYVNVTLPFPMNNIEVYVTAQKG